MAIINATGIVVLTKAQLQQLIDTDAIEAGKQYMVVDGMDTEPTLGSMSPVTSDGVKRAIQAVANIEAGVIYDQVIRTQTEFEALIASPTWLDAKSVALVGQFVYDEPDNSGIKVPATVKQIHGFNSAKITITNFKYDENTAKGGLWYDTLPTTNDYSIRDLEVDCTGTGTNDYGYGFVNCTNLTNCTGKGTGTGTNGVGFRNCTNLTNCTGTGTGTGSSGYGFSYCTSLTSCTGTGTGTTSYGFYYCTSLTSCTGTGTGISYGYGFYNCTNLTNCTGTGTGTGTGISYGFGYCKNLTSCTGKGTGNTGYGFFRVSYASNCKDGGSATNMWDGDNYNIDVETCRKTSVKADNITLNT